MSRRLRRGRSQLTGEENWTGLGGGGGGVEGNMKTQFLTSAFKSGEDLNAVNLKGLYALMLHHLPSSSSFFKQEEILHLSHVLFPELKKRFHGNIFSSLPSSCHGEVSVTHPGSTSKVSVLLLLLRCCLLLLTFGAFDSSRPLEQGKHILSVLAKLFSISTHLLNSTRESVISIALLELGPSLPNQEFLCEVLEVFTSELLVHKSLRHVLFAIDATAPKSNMIFSSHRGGANIGCILEVLCAHFIVSFSHAQAFENFIDRLFWHCEGHFRTPQISLSVILPLLLDPILSSAPQLFQAYLVLLASDALGIFTSSENTRPDLSSIECSLMAFKRSVFFYTRHMCSLFVDDHPFCLSASSISSCLLGEDSMETFESLLQPATRVKLHHVISKSNSAWDSYLSKMPSAANSDLVAVYIAYVKENLYNLNESHKDEVLSILSSLLLRVSSDGAGDNISHKKVEARPQDIYLLASLLKLMSSSLLQAIRSLRNSGCLKSLEGVSSCEEYVAIMDTVTFFEQFSNQLPIQKVLHEMVQSHPAIHKNSLWMFLHFSGLLSLSYASRLDFLVKDCLFILLTLLSLYIIEEGDLKVLGSLFSCRLVSLTSKASDNMSGALVIHKSSLKISPKVWKIQKMYLRKFESIMTGRRNDGEDEVKWSDINEEILLTILHERVKKLPPTSDEERQNEEEFLQHGVHVATGDEVQGEGDGSSKGKRSVDGNVPGSRRSKRGSSGHLDSCMEHFATSQTAKADCFAPKAKKYKGADGEVTSPLRDAESVIVCMEELDKIDCVSGDAYNFALVRFENPYWRKVFMKMPMERKKYWLMSLK